MKSFKKYKIWVVMLSVFLLSSILGSQAKAGWVELSGKIYYDGGNVGIGTTEPTAKLDVRGYIATDVVNSFQAGDPLELQYSIAGDVIVSGSDSNLQVQGTGNSSFTGNLGIGITIPASKLHVNGGQTYLVYNHASSPALDVRNAGGGAAAVFGLGGGNVGIGTANPGHKLMVMGTTSEWMSRVTTDWTLSTGSGLMLGVGGNTGNTFSEIRAMSSGVNAWNNLVLQSGGGNVGIGTTSPASKLHVNGGQTYLVYDHASSAALDVRNAGGGPVAIFGLNGGNVGIGTSNPTARLAVNGTIKAKEVIVSTTAADWPDVVFKDDYELMKLNDLEQNIKENGHLPNIPSAGEVAENGVSVGEMQSKLLQKVEELTLYVIDQNKRIALLEKENESLKKSYSVK
ncbi:MAG: hypothetical protein PHX78_03855 [bacterium]|nr:hypothetical protein [bacterium]